MDRPRSRRAGTPAPGSSRGHSRRSRSPSWCSPSPAESSCRSRRSTQGVLLGDRTAVGIVIGAFAVSSLLMRPFAGRLADQRSRRIASCSGRRSRSRHAWPPRRASVDLIHRPSSWARARRCSSSASPCRAPTSRRPIAAGRRSASSPFRCTSGSRSARFAGEVVLDGWGYAAVWIVTATLYAVSVGLSWIVPETLSTGEEDAPEQMAQVSGSAASTP